MALPGDTFGPYRLVRPIGQGGMGHVFAAVHERLGQTVALKLLAPSADREPQVAARFIQEARAMAHVQHPGVVRVFDCDRKEDGTIYLAMELLSGLTLRDWMRQQPGPVPLGTALALCQQLADILVDVHSRGIVHRDLKPENVFLCPDEHLAPGYRVKLLDFGIAKVRFVNSGEEPLDTLVHTQGPAFIGTATYMAPEQCRRAAEVEGSADVYALGVLLFELLAGRPPFVSNELLEVLSLHMHAEPPPLQQLVPQVPGALSAFIASMLAKAPAQRPTMARCRDMLGRDWRHVQEECPLPGLQPFTDTQAELFFGRKAESEELLHLLEESRSGLRRWVQLEGPSGVGKSSLVQAGLLPRLREQQTGQGPRWLVACVRPSYSPLHSLALALHAAYAPAGSAQPAEEIEQALRAAPGALHAWVAARTPLGCCLLLVLEQMEELFTLGAPECGQLGELLATALSEADSPLRMLTTLRSDFIHRLEQLPALARQLNRAARYLLRPMEEQTLAQVAQDMAQRVGLRLSEGLAERMAREARSESSQLPLLSHTLRLLWSPHSGTRLTHERYEQLGGVGGALAQQAEQLLDSLGAQGRERAKWLLLDLVQVGRGAPDTRRPRSRQEVLRAAGGDELAEAVLLHLSGLPSNPAEQSGQGLRLVALSGGPTPALQRVDLVHETLLQRVPSLVGWIERERALLERHADLEATAHAWEQAGCPSEGLPSGSLLAHYLGFVAPSQQQGPHAHRLSERAARFLEAARRLDRRRAWLRRSLALAATVAVAAISLSAALALQARQRAEDSAAFALQAQQRAENTLQRIIEIADSVVTDVDWELSWLPHTLEVRSSMLEQLDQELDALPKPAREQPEVIRLRVGVKQRRGDLSFHDRTLDSAEDFLNAAHAELDRGLALHPESPPLWTLRALQESKLGKVAQARGQHSEARRHFAQSIALLERLRASGSGDNDTQQSLATSYHELADQELETGRVDAAVSLADQASELFEQEGDDYSRALLAHALCTRGKAARLANSLEAAQGLLDRALEMQQRIVQDNAGDMYFRWVLAWIHVELAALHASRGQAEEAERNARRAVELGEELRTVEEESKRYALVLAQGLVEYEALLAARRDPRAQAIREERCSLVARFIEKDGADQRFQRLACN